MSFSIFWRTAALRGDILHSPTCSQSLIGQNGSQQWAGRQPGGNYQTRHFMEKSLN